MIERTKQNQVRIPILIELRGKSPRNLTTQEILATWAAQYRIDAQALLRLHIAGRLLIIFEGFDEMALIGNFEVRLQHFRRLWEFCYPQAKILITGRPNFFLDDEEMRLALGISQPTGNNHYCEAIRLAPFSVEQIEESLRQQKPEIKEQISSVAKTNSGFCDLVARPSLLHVVSVIWEQENLGDEVENLNSAYVMERFVKNSYRRQGLKAESSDNQSRKYFMALNTSEREYFMSGIAAYMVSKKLSNQISAIELNKLIEDLIDAIPNSVSTSVDAMSGEDRRPLKSWIREPQEDIEHIKTDVRTCGLLVDDPAVPGTFKFGHKSFMEYLFASTIANSITESQQQDIQAILKTTKASISQIIELPVSVDFLSEIIIQNDISKYIINNKKSHDIFMVELLYKKCFRIRKSLLLFFLSKMIILDLVCFVLFIKNKHTRQYDNIKDNEPPTIDLLLILIALLLSPMSLIIAFFILCLNRLDIIVGIQILLGSIIIIPIINLFVKIVQLFFLKDNLYAWTKLCRKIGIKDEILHKFIGTWNLPWFKNQKFNKTLRHRE